MNIEKIIYFLKSDIRGLIVLGISTSIIAAIIFDLSKKAFARLSFVIKKKIYINKLRKSIFSYGRGYTAGYAHTSTYRQVVLVGEFIINIILQVGWCLFTSLVFIILLIFIKQPNLWGFVIIFSAILTFQYLKIKEVIDEYQHMLKAVFGDDFFKKQEKAIKDRFDQKEHEEEDGH